MDDLSDRLCASRVVGFHPASELQCRSRSNGLLGCTRGPNCAWNGWWVPWECIATRSLAWFCSGIDFWKSASTTGNELTLLLISRLIFGRFSNGLHDELVKVLGARYRYFVGTWDDDHGDILDHPWRPIPDFAKSEYISPFYHSTATRTISTLEESKCLSKRLPKGRGLVLFSCKSIKRQKGEPIASAYSSWPPGSSHTGRWLVSPPSSSRLFRLLYIWIQWSRLPSFLDWTLLVGQECHQSASDAELGGHLVERLQNRFLHKMWVRRPVGLASIIEYRHH